LPKYKFKPSERYAVFTVHGETCYLCRKPIDMATFQVDHIIPESLASQPEVFAQARHSYGLPDAFDLNSFENWMPACAPCNNRKRENVFEALPIFAVELKKASEKADHAREIESDVRSNQQVSRAVVIIETAHQQGTLNTVHFDRLRPLFEYHEKHREPEKAEAPLLIGPNLEVLSRHGELVTIKGPYGIGVGRANPPNYGGFRCGSCGYSSWNGARCVVCGAQDDD
jgi:hypothetical protein